jgi:hypothetical protein
VRLHDVCPTGPDLAPPGRLPVGWEVTLVPAAAAAGEACTAVVAGPGGGTVEFPALSRGEAVDAACGWLAGRGLVVCIPGPFRCQPAPAGAAVETYPGGYQDVPLPMEGLGP